MPTQARKQALEDLDHLAGHPSIVDDALRALTEQLSRTPTLSEMMEEILRRRLELERAAQNHPAVQSRN
jgi:hypothetical protein